MSGKSYAEIGRQSKNKGTKFERRILHEFEYYGGLIVRCAMSKPVDLVWMWEGITFVVECKDRDSLQVKITLENLRQKCVQGGTHGLLVWQDKNYMVNIYLIRPNSIEICHFTKTQDLLSEMKLIRKRLGR